MSTDNPPSDPSALRARDPSRDPSRDPFASDDDLRRCISAAADGDPPASEPACRAWREHGPARQAWHTYHLIGDVMRSGDLATPPARDEAFLKALRTRLAAEPVVLAPAATPASQGSARREPPRWWVPAAAAAGVAAVAGVLVVSRLSEPQTPQVPQVLTAAVPASAARANAPVPRADAEVIRDARLDDYLQAHQSARGGMGAAVPGSVLRRVDLDLPAGAAK